MTDFNNYVDPGVYIQEISTPVLSTAGLQPAVVAIIADSQRYQSYSERVVLNATTAVTLTKQGISLASIVVVDRYTGIQYALTTDYTVTAGVGADTVASTADDTTTIVRVGGGTIVTGTEVLVSYNYTDTNYYLPKLYTDHDTIVDTYGKALTSVGAISSPMTLAAYFAFLNGATQVMCVPVKAVSTTPTTQEWQTAIDLTRTEMDVDAIVVIEGATTLHSYILQHVTTLEAQGSLRRAFVGIDGTTSVKAPSDFRTAATTFASSRIALVAPGTFDFATGVGSTTLKLGGQYMAAAMAGAWAGRSPQTPLTRKTLQGFSKVNTSWSEAEMTQTQQKGVVVLQQRRNGQIIVRHGLTTNMTSVYTQEVSVQSAKDALYTLLKDTLDAQGLVGSVITPDTPNYVVSAVVGVLDSAKSSSLINDYSGVKYRIPTNQPTLIQVRFMYKPSLPLNYVQVQFSIDTQTGSASFIDLNV